MDWLVIGSGLLGQGFTRYLPDAVQMRRPDHDLRTIQFVPKTSNGTAVICGAVTGFKQCEMFPAWSYDVNVFHTLRVARLAHDAGWNVVMLSSPAAANPSTEYGRQKATVEAKWSFGSIVRLPKILHRDHPLMWSWRHNLEHGRLIRPHDSMIQPIRVFDAVEAVRSVAHTRGLMFETPGPTTTWFHVAFDLARSWGFDTELVRPVHADNHYGLMSSETIRNTGWVSPTYDEIVTALL